MPQFEAYFISDILLTLLCIIFLYCVFAYFYIPGMESNMLLRDRFIDKHKVNAQLLRDNISKSRDEYNEKIRVAKEAGEASLEKCIADHASEYAEVMNKKQDELKHCMSEMRIELQKKYNAERIKDNIILESCADDFVNVISK